MNRILSVYVIVLFTLVISSRGFGAISVLEQQPGRLVVRLTLDWSSRGQEIDGTKYSVWKNPDINSSL